MQHRQYLQHYHLPFLRRIPRLYKSLLRLVCIILRAYFLHADFCAILCEDDVLLLQLVDAALGEFVRVQENLEAHMR